MAINDTTDAQETIQYGPPNKNLKARLTTLKGWLTRKHIVIFDAPVKGTEMVVYDAPHGKRIAYYMSPNRLKDSETVRKYFETKAKLDYHRL
jgi:hypothetical protein